MRNKTEVSAKEALEDFGGEGGRRGAFVILPLRYQLLSRGLRDDVQWLLIAAVDKSLASS